MIEEKIIMCDNFDKRRGIEKCTTYEGMRKCLNYLNIMLMYKK